MKSYELQRHPSRNPRLYHLALGGMLLAFLLCMIWQAPGRAYGQARQGDSAIVTILGAAQPPGYAPALLTVHVYDTVVFVNRSVPAAPYAVIADDGDFSSPPIPPGQQWSVTFSSPGAFEYQESTSSPHMAGVIVVVPSSVPLLPSPVPAAQATALAYIKAGKMPPDTVSQQVNSPGQVLVSRKQTQPGVSLFASPGLFALFFAGSAVLIITLELLIFGLVKWSKPAYLLVKGRIRKIHLSREEDEEDDE